MKSKSADNLKKQTIQEKMSFSGEDSATDIEISR